MNTHGNRPPEKRAPLVQAPDTTSAHTREPQVEQEEDLENTVLGNIGHAQDGPGADPDHSIVPLTTTTAGLTSRGEYATDPATGGGRYMGHGAGTFGMDPVDPSGEDHDTIDPKI